MVQRNPRNDPRQIKGFRPGKEPPELRRRQARESLGPNASWAQKQMVDLIGERRPDEVAAMVRRWSLGLAALGACLVLGGVFLYAWSTVAGISVHIVAAALFFLAFRVNRQGGSWVDAAQSMHPPKGSRRSRGKKRS